MCGLENSKFEKYEMGLPQGFNCISIYNGKFQFTSVVLWFLFVNWHLRIYESYICNFVAQTFETFFSLWVLDLNFSFSAYLIV
jgi:hypothetical protein